MLQEREDRAGGVETQHGAKKLTDTRLQGEPWRLPLLAVSLISNIIGRCGDKLHLREVCIALHSPLMCRIPLH